MKLKQRILCVLGACILTLGISNPAEAINQIEKVRYIVIVDSNSLTAASSDRVFANYAGAVIHRYEHVFDGYVVELPKATAESALGRIQGIISFEKDMPIFASAIQNPTPSWGLDRIDQRGPVSPVSNGSYEYASAGSSSTIYIVDTGVYRHADFGSRLSSAGFTSINDGYGSSDCDGHGTHVASTAAGTQFGVAKNAMIVPVRVLDCTGRGTYSGFISGMDWILSSWNPNSKVRAVVNMSLGGPYSSSLNSAVARLTNAGITVVAAAGNDAVDACYDSPGSAPSAITVGATDRADARSLYSNYGSCVDIHAPGSRIVGAGHTSPSAVVTMDGTSMASPHVAGIAAVYLGLNPSATVAQVTQFIDASSTKNVISGLVGNTVNKLAYVSPTDSKSPQATLSISNTTRTNAVGTSVALTTAGGSGTGAVSYAVTGTNCTLTNATLGASAATTCVVTATKASDVSFAQAVSNPVSFNFMGAQATLSISNSTLSNPVGTSVTLTTAGGSGTGAVTYALSTVNALCSLRRNILTTTANTTCSVVATKAASGVFASATSAPVVFSFKGPQATLSISNSTLTIAVGTSVTLTTAGGSGSGAVSYAVTGANCTLTNATLGATAATTCVVTATKAADVSFAQTVSAPVTFTFRGPQATLSVSNSTLINAVGTAVTLTTAGGSGSGAVSYAVTGTNCTLTNATLGATAATTCVVTATKAADSTFAQAVSAPVSFNFMGAQATLSISNSTLTNAVGTSVTLTTTGGSGSGAITYALSTANALCSLSGATVTANQPTQCSIVATKAAQGLFASITSSAVVFTFQGPQATLSISNSTLTNPVGTSITLTTTGGSGSGAVTYALSTANALCSLSGANVTASQPTQCSVVATKVAHGLFISITSSAVVFTFKSPQATLSISNSTLTNTAGTAVTLTTAGGSGSGAVSYAVTGTNCTLANATLGATAATTCVVTATKASDISFAQAVSNPVSFNFMGAQATLSISNSTLSNPVGSSVTLTTAGGSGTGVVTFALPNPNAACSIRRGAIAASAATTCSVVATKAASGVFASATSAPVVFSFKGPQATLSISNSTLTNAIGTAVTLTTAGGSGTGAVTYAVTGTNCTLTGATLGATAATTCVVTASKAQDNLFVVSNTATQNFFFLVDQAVLSITNSALTHNAGTVVTLTSSGGSGTGAITYALSTTNPLCSLVGATVTANQPTQCSVVATKAAQGLYASKTSAPVTFTFRGPQATLSVSNTTRTNAVGTAVTLTTAGGSGSGAVTYAVTGANCTLVNATLGATAAATCIVTATKAADSTFAQAVSTPVTFSFLGAQAALSISNSTLTNPVGTSVTLTTTGGSGSGAITYALSNPNSSCSVRRNILIARAGTVCSVIATKAASGIFAAIVSEVKNFIFN